jgi:hypothetical protein
MVAFTFFVVDTLAGAYWVLEGRSGYRRAEVRQRS